MSSFRSRGLPLVTVMAVVLLAAACASGAAAPAGGGSSGGDGGGSRTEGSPLQPASAGDRTGGGAASGDSGNAPLRDDARIVYTAALSVQVGDLEAAVRAGREAVAALGGYVGASRQSADGEASVASITYRIPAGRWEEGLAAFRALGTVIDEQTDAVEVTGQLVDLEARLRNLRASETALQRIAEQATRIDDILEVERRLTELRGQIEQLDAQRTHLADQAAFGTVTVTYGRQVVAVVEAAKSWNPGQEVDRATATLVDVLQALTTAGIWFAIVWLPILLALLVLALAARFVLRRSGILQGTARPGTSQG